MICYHVTGGCRRDIAPEDAHHTIETVYKMHDDCAAKACASWGVKLGDLRDVRWAIEAIHRDQMRKSITPFLDRDRVYKALAHLGVPFNRPEIDPALLDSRPPADRQTPPGDR